MSAPRITRRRFLVAAAVASLVAPARPVRLDWRGSALGAEARIVLEGPRDRAEAALAAAAAEIERLEALFSLHRPGSQLSRLNGEGRLTLPARELRRLLAAAEAWRARTEGAFDARVQPLWAHRAAGGSGPGPVASVAATRIADLPGRLALPAGGAITLNGIAQGTIADRVAGLLAREGFAPALVDAGELRLAPGRALAIPHAGIRVAAAHAAAATSAPGALRFAGGGHHLFDPASGTSPERWRAVTVLGPDAETADALSPAFAVSERARLGDLVPEGVAVVATDHAGRVHRFGRGIRET